MNERGREVDKHRQYSRLSLSSQKQQTRFTGGLASLYLMNV